MADHEESVDAWVSHPDMSGAEANLLPEDITKYEKEGPTWSQALLTSFTMSSIDSYRLGLAVGATIKAFAVTYGEAALRKATGGINFGGQDDPSVGAIQSQFGDDPLKEGEELYQYKRGLSKGIKRYWGTLGQNQQ
ncbi:MAG TPA: hypothetical protein VI756_05780 [Blastocatellia bacterium]